MTETKSKKAKKRHVPHRSKRLPRGPGGGIELLLVQSVDKLGNQGDVVEVKPGYANNYLLPQGLATISTGHHKRMVDKHKARLLEIQRTRLAGLQALADQLRHESITIEANANDEGHLYGSVGAAEIAGALKTNNFTISPPRRAHRDGSPWPPPHASTPATRPAESARRFWIASPLRIWMPKRASWGACS